MFSKVFFISRECQFRLSLSLEIPQNSRLWAKEWAKGILASIGSRGSERLRFRACLPHLNRQGLHGSGKIVESRMRVAARQVKVSGRVPTPDEIKSLLSVAAGSKP